MFHDKRFDCLGTTKFGSFHLNLEVFDLYGYASQMIVTVQQ